MGLSCAWRPAASRFATVSFAVGAALSASCGTVAETDVDAAHPEVSSEGPDDALEDPPAKTEATAARDYLAAWQRCVSTTQGRVGQTWERYATAFKVAEGRPRSRDIEPYLYDITGTVTRCAVGGTLPTGVDENIATLGATYVQATEAVAETVAAMRAAIAVEGAKKGGFAAIATLGPKLGTEHALWTTALDDLAAALAPARDEVDGRWLAEVAEAEGKGLRWLTGRTQQAARQLALCEAAAPKAAECAEAIDAFSTATQALEAHCAAHPEAPLGAFWLDVFRAKLAPALKGATQLHAPQKSRKKAAIAARAVQAKALAEALTELALAGDRVRFDFP